MIAENKDFQKLKLYEEIFWTTITLFGKMSFTVVTIKKFAVDTLIFGIEKVLLFRPDYWKDSITKLMLISIHNEAKVSKMVNR